MNNPDRWGFTLNEYLKKFEKFYIVFLWLYFVDRKFALKARLNRVLPVTLSLIKNNSNNFKFLQTYLNVFKHYTSNSKYFVWSYKSQTLREYNFENFYLLFSLYWKIVLILKLLTRYSYESFPANLYL